MQLSALGFDVSLSLIFHKTAALLGDLLPTFHGFWRHRDRLGFDVDRVLTSTVLVPATQILKARQVARSFA